MSLLNIAADPLIRSVKTAFSVVVGAGAVLYAQISDFDFGAIGNLTGIAAVALVVGRYTFRQLEDYRKDLRLARERGDLLEARLNVMEERERLLLTHVNRLERIIHSNWPSLDESTPPFPDLPSLPDASPSE